MPITALAGGVGAAKFLRGLVAVVDPEAITIVGNTGDDANFHGLAVSPDLDIVTYTLAGIVGDLGWGINQDTTRALDTMHKLGVDAWFTLGDSDLGTHLARTTWLHEGLPLSEVTDRIRRALGVGPRIIPMSDDPVRTRIITSAGIEREFQDYFVRWGHTEEVADIRFEGAGRARPAPGVIEAIEAADRIIVCPSNPAVSIGPILAVPGVRSALRSRRSSVLSISPIVQGAALKGPAARLLGVLGVDASAAGVAGLYRDFCGSFVLDRQDVSEIPAVEKLGVRANALDTIMDSPEAARRLASEILQW